MDYIRGLEAYQDSREAAITLGKFDGVHRRHLRSSLDMIPSLDFPSFS